jgi:2-polyprenyl-3-methyl-5-hydroxy-6-metoxy-1,4-benzoquinol methylase
VEEAETVITVADLEALSPARFAPLRADVIVLSDQDADPRFAQTLADCVHDAGEVWLLPGSERMARALETRGMVGTGRPGVYQKERGVTPPEYDTAYINRWGDLDFTRNWEAESREILVHLPAGMDARSVTVLDVGCLNGYIMEALRRAGVRRVFGTDISYEIAVARTVNRYHLPAISIGDFSGNRYPDNFSDLTICMEVLEHIRPESTEAFIAQLARVTSPGGTILISTSEDWAVDPTHVNCRNRADWYYQFSRVGLAPQGSQIIFPGFNSFVLRRTHNPVARLVWRLVCRLRLALRGKLAPPARESAT